MISFIQNILPFIIGFLAGYKYPSHHFFRDKWCILHFLMVCVWLWAITRPFVLILYMLGVR